MRQLIKTEEKPKKLFKIIRVGIMIVVIIFVLEIWMINRLTTFGNKIAGIKETKKALELENRVLENMIAQNSSLNVLEKKASELGFGNIKNIEYIKLP